MASEPGSATEDLPVPPDPSKAPPRKRSAFDGAFLFIAVVGISGALATWFLRGPDVFVSVAGRDLTVLLETLPKIAAAVLLACWLRRMLPREAIARHFGAESGWRGLVIASGAGILVPGGPVTAYPLAIAFLEGGADRGTVVSFITAWLVISLQRTVVWEMAFLDLHIVAIRLLVTLPVPILLGWLARRARGVFDIAPELDRQGGRER